VAKLQLEANKVEELETDKTTLLQEKADLTVILLKFPLMTGKRQRT
jgi:hypothetical protein